MFYENNFSSRLNVDASARVLTIEYSGASGLLRLRFNEFAPVFTPIFDVPASGLLRLRFNPTRVFSALGARAVSDDLSEHFNERGAVAQLRHVQQVKRQM